MKLTYSIMKIKVLQFLLIGLVIFISSCEKDGTINPEVLTNNKVEYNGENLSINAAGFVDYNLRSFYGNAPTHKNVDFYTIDGTFITSKTGSLLDISGKSVVFAELNSPNLDMIETATYNYINDSKDSGLTDTELSAKYSGKYFFTNAYVISSSQSSSLLTFSQNIDVVSGTVKISGSKPNYLITYDLVLENGKTLKGNYAGIFQSL
ncbi:hypothetical protein A5893_15455 [Pedobacter psychrophilus]|uniref:Uncharacterized protein n=2 Tax=Pedobacter psychrophilus TaxID=1826909 RepID=A0A179DCK3_9SPHI|nr:hypothetical protein A5893_15455 [Pedobacter psychrophilus]